MRMPEGGEGPPIPKADIKPAEQNPTSKPEVASFQPKSLPPTHRHITPEEALQAISGIHPEQRYKKPTPFTETNAEAALIPTPTIQEREQLARESGFHPDNPNWLKIGETFTRTGSLVNPELQPVDLLSGVDSTKWPQELQEILVLAETIKPDTRERARLTIQYITALPVEGWKHPDLNAKLKEAYKYYVQGTYGIKDLERENPEAAKRLIQAQEEILKLNATRTTRPLTAAENARLNKLWVELRTNRDQLSDVQREATDMNMIGGILERQLEERDKRLVEDEKKNEALLEAKKQKALQDFLEIQAKEQSKKENDKTHEVRTHAKILEDLKEFIADKETGEPIEAIKKYRTLTTQLKSAGKFVATNPRIAKRIKHLEEELNKVKEAGERWDALNKERETYLLAAAALGITKGVEARVAGYYVRNRNNIIEGDLAGFHEFVEDMDTRPKEREYLDRVSTQEDLEVKFGEEQALEIDVDLLNDMLIGTIRDYTDDAIVELNAQAHRFAIAADTNQPLLQLIAEDHRFGSRAGRFDSRTIEQSLRSKAASERRRRLIERKTYEEVPQNVRDEDLHRYDRNDYNYLMIFATSESELREALTDIILYRASPDAPFDVNELLQDITRVDNLLEGFKRRFKMEESYERMKFEFDGTLKAIGGAHFAYIGDEATEAKIGAAWTQTYGPKRRQFVFEGGQEPGINAFILDDKENNPINKKVEQLDGYEGELHNEQPSQRQFWKEWITFEAHRALGALLHSPELNQRKLGLDVPRSEFQALYWEDIYKEGKFDLDKLKEKVLSGEKLTREERWTCELLAVASRQTRQKLSEKLNPGELDRVKAFLGDHVELINAFVESIKLDELLETVEKKRRPIGPKDKQRLTLEEQSRYDFACRYFGRRLMNGEIDEPELTAEALFADEWKIFDYLVAQEGAPAYEQRLKEKKVTEDTKDRYERIYWLARIQQLTSTGKSDEINGDLGRVYRWFYKPAHDRMVAQVGLALNFETFMGEAAERSSSTFVADNGDYLPDDGIYDFMHVVRFAAEQVILEGIDYHTVKERTAALQGAGNKELEALRRDYFERIWDEALEKMARKGFLASYELPEVPILNKGSGRIINVKVYDDGKGMPVLHDKDELGYSLQPFKLTFEQARKHPGKLWSMDTYMATERIVSDLIQSDRHQSDAMAMRFMLPHEDPATGKVKLVDDVKDGAYLLPRHLWVLDPQGKILRTEDRQNRPSSFVENEVMEMVDESARKHLFIQRRVMRKLSSRPLRPKRGGYTDADYEEIKARSGLKFKLDERGRYVGKEGTTEHIKLRRGDEYDQNWQPEVIRHAPIAGQIFERQLNGYLVQVNSPDENDPNRFSRMVLKTIDDEKPSPDDQVPVMDDRARLGGENLAAGLSRLRLKRMNKYMRVKIARFSRFREMASTIPSMLLPDHRIHGALDMRQGVAVTMTESFSQQEKENARSDFLIENANTFMSLGLQGKIYRRWFDGPVEGNFEDANSSKPLTDGDNFGELHHYASEINKSSGAIKVRNIIRPIFAKFEEDIKILEQKEGYSRVLSTGLARLQGQLHANDAFDVLEGPGIDRDYPNIKHFVPVVNADAEPPIGNIRDSVIGQMVRGRPRHYTKKVRGTYTLNWQDHHAGLKVGTHTIVDELW